MGITKRQLTRSVEKIKEVIGLANNENILNVTVEFFQQVKFLGDNRGEIPFRMKRKKKSALLFVYLKKSKKFKISK